ncbi:DDE-type integrase/transposase/recombinase [Rubripirellula sp.]|nr:DDE-type integrase/transposase/recombinase [Rubripirellula sp.]MDB4621892.1 DDE-type integrase/transposase/recombinase [Rubripirellula sp.]
MWSYDFVTDRTWDDRQLRLLVVIGEYTRECLAIEVGRSFTAQEVMGVLQYPFAVRGTPEQLRSDNFAATTSQRQLGNSTMTSALSSYPESFAVG